MKRLLPALIFIALLTSSAWGMNIQLQWNPVSSTSVAGYRIYYSATGPEHPLQGTGALEGSSPVDVGNATTATLSNLPNQPYYISVTAYSAEGLESPYSNIVCNYWMPVRTYPVDGATNISRDVEFAWSQPADPSQYQFTVLVGPHGGPLNQQMRFPLVPSATLGGGHGGPTATGAATAGMVTLICLVLLFVGRTIRWRWLAACLMGAALLASCGGGDSSSFSTAIDGSGGSATALLEPNTLYDWKVVANNGTVQVESTTGSFTTGSN